MSNLQEKTNLDPYRKYLEKKHGGFEASEELIEKIVEKATGSRPIKRSRIIEGEVNEVYDVTTEDKQDVIVRISRQGRANFETEERVIRMALMVGVPAPKVLLIEDASSGPEKLTFCVEEKIEGESLKKLMGSMDKSTLKSIISEAGRILSKINSITVERFGHLDGPVIYKTWGDYIFNLENKRDRIIEIGESFGIETSTINGVFKLLRENEKVFQVKEPKLLHGDFSPKHLVIKSNHIVGVLDFEDAKGGDPVQDLARINYFNYNVFPIDWLKEGYGNKDLFDDNFDLKMKLYRLQMGLGFLDYYNSENNESGINYTKDRLIADLKSFRS
ncbi:MAG: phosphotransferase [Candidatus Woesebacteria bacterium]|nr:phosphotransferase [Candidatus Woesebacteria bacterium]